MKLIVHVLRKNERLTHFISFILKEHYSPVKFFEPPFSVAAISRKGVTVDILIN